MEYVYANPHLIGIVFHNHRCPQDMCPIDLFIFTVVYFIFDTGCHDGWTQCVNCSAKQCNYCNEFHLRIAVWWKCFSSQTCINSSSYLFFFVFRVCRPCGLTWLASIILCLVFIAKFWEEYFYCNALLIEFSAFLNSSVVVFQGIFEPFLKSFYVRSTDPTHIRILKLEALTNLASETNISTILREFQVCITIHYEPNINSEVGTVTQLYRPKLVS